MLSNINLSTKALNDMEKLIVGFKHDRRLAMSLKNREDLLDRLTLATTGLMMLMTELDRQRAVDIIAKYRMVKAFNRSICRLRNHELYKTA